MEYPPVAIHLKYQNLSPVNLFYNIYFGFRADLLAFPNVTEPCLAIPLPLCFFNHLVYVLWPLPLSWCCFLAAAGFLTHPGCSIVDWDAPLITRAMSEPVGLSCSMRLWLSLHWISFVCFLMTEVSAPIRSTILLLFLGETPGLGLALIIFIHLIRYQKQSLNGLNHKKKITIGLLHRRSKG